MENERCKIQFNNGTGIYFSGQTINGTISLLSNKGKRIRGVYFKLHGYGKCGWYTLIKRGDPSTTATSSTSPGYLIRNPTNSNTTKDSHDVAVQFSGKEDYLIGVVYLVGSKNGPSFELPDGTTTYNFSYQLPDNLPSSFKGSYGKIKYKMEFIVDKPWKFDEKYCVILTIFRSLNKNDDRTVFLAQEKQITRNIGIFGSGPVSLYIQTPRSCYAPGEQMPLHVDVTNNSSTHVDKVKFSLRKIIDYYSTMPHHNSKQEIEKILKKEAGGVDGGATQKYEHLLTIPQLPATDNIESHIIHIRYEIKVDVKFNGLYKNLIECLPITIASVPLQQQYTTDGTTLSSSTSPSIAIAQLPIALSSPPPAIGFVPSEQLSVHQNLPQSTFARLSIASNTSISGISPSAPPSHDFHSISPNSTRSSICSSQFSDAPPSYEDVFGSPSSLNSSIRSVKSQISTNTSPRDIPPKICSFPQ